MRSIIGIVLALLLVGAVLASLGCCAARAHSWYDPECCSDSDCFAVPSIEVTEIDNGGWKHLPTGTVFTRQQVKPSRDRRFHVCIGNKAHDMGRPYCIYILQGS